MYKALRKAIMHRSIEKKHLQRKRADVNWANYKKTTEFLCHATSEN